MSLRVSCSHLLCSMFLHTRFTRPSRIRRMIHFPLRTEMFLHARFTRPSRIRRMIHFAPRTKWRANSQREMFLHARFTRPRRIRRMIHFAPRTEWRANSQREMFLHARFTKTKKNPENDPFRSEHRMKSHAEACQNQRLNGLIVYVCVCVCEPHICIIWTPLAYGPWGPFTF